MFFNVYSDRKSCSRALGFVCFFNFFESFHTSVSWWFFQWSLNDNKSPQVSMTLLSILANLNNAVVQMVSTRHLILKSFSLCTNHLVIVMSAPFTIGYFTQLLSCTVFFFFFWFFSFNSLARSRYLSFVSLSFSFTLWWTWIANSTVWQVLFSFLFFFLLSLGLVIWPRLNDLFVSQNTQIICAFHSLGWIPSCAYIIWLYGQL